MGAVKQWYQDEIEKKQQKWCKTHVTGYWGKDQFGTDYAQCSAGHKKRMQGIIEECIEGENDPAYESES